MKKFYYKKEVSSDKTPIILRLERRRTVNASKDTGQEEQGRLFTRSTSISGLDQLKYDPSIPRVRRPREITKSLSEDVLSSCSYTTPSGVVITEAELSSSWLYKNMKAAANLRDENDNKNACSSVSTEQEDLTPKALEDPKMKPIPVPITGRSKTSCCCYLGIMIAISLCTIGFLSAIGGILYMELISKGNLTAHPTEETNDVNLFLYNSQLQELRESTKAADQAETDDNSDERKSGIHNPSNTEVTEDLQKTIHILDFGKPSGAELSQYIDNRRTEIKLRNVSSKIYEGNVSDSVEYRQNYITAKITNEEGNFHQNNAEGNLSDTTNDLNEISGIQADIVSEKVIKVANTDMALKSDPSEKSNVKEEKVYLDLNVTSNSEVVNEETKQTKTDVELKSKVFVESMIDKETRKQTDAEEASVSFANEMVYSKMTDRYPEDKLVANHRHSVPDQNLESMYKSEMELKSVVESLPTDSNINEEIYDRIKEEESTILIIDDSEYESPEDNSKEGTFISKRKGDFPDVGVSHSRTKTSARIKSGKEYSGFPSDLAQRFRQQLKSGEIQARKKPINRLKVAEVMKQLKALDVNNRLASYRIKLAKPNIKTIKLASKSASQKEQKEILEKNQYLEKLRFMLYGHL